MSLCFDSLHCAEDPAAKWIRSPRPKQETGERTRGRLMFRARIQIVSRCASANQERGVCVCVCVQLLWGGLIQDWEETHTCIHTQTHTQTATYRLYCRSICVPLALQFEGVGHCYVDPKTEGRMVVFRPSLFYTPNCTQILHTPTACSQARTIHNIRGQRGHKEVHTWRTGHCGLLCLQMSVCVRLCYCHNSVELWLC